MPITLDGLRASIKAENTILLLGAGASIPSGAPSGVALAARLWKDVAKTEPQSDDLIETASVLERRHGRRAVVEVVRKNLENLKPTGGLLSIPRFGWSAVFSTNFDQLVEKSYKAASVQLTPIRSNFDLTNRENREGTSLYKIHGCITQDRGFGDKASMIITEQDYDEYQRYRQSMFSNLKTMMMTNDVIILGQSLRDRHLNDLVKKVLSFRADGIESSVNVVVYERDDLRAPLLEDRGAIVAFGGIDEFSHAFAENIIESDSKSVLNDAGEFNLPANLVSTVHDVSIKVTEIPNPVKMSSGGPASYADIRSGVTFERSRFAEAIEKITSNETPVIVVVGAAGVGKTTFARQIAEKLIGTEIVWEHRNDFPFQSKPWISLERDLHNAGRSAVLVLYECPRYMRQTNMLVDALGKLEKPALRVVSTAKSPIQKLLSNTSML